MAVQLPDFSSLGVVNPQPATAQPVYPQTSAVAQGETTLGQGIEKAGGTIEDIAAYSQMARNRMDRAMADADFTTRYIPLVEKIRTETDPAKLDELTAQLRELPEISSQAIGDAGARELWTKQSEKHAAQGLGEAQIRQTHVYNDRYKAGVIGQADSLSRTGAVASDPAAFSLAQDNIAHLMKSGQESGALTAVEAEQYSRAATKQLVDGRARFLANNGDPDGARAFLAQHTADLDAITLQSLEAHIETKGDQTIALRAVNQALGRSPGGAVTPQQGDVGQKLAATFKARGWSDAAIVGALNNGITESGLDPNATGGGGERGVFQFHPGSHLPVFQQSYKGDASPEAQASYVADWVDQNMPGYAQSGDARSATSRFFHEFEAPKDQSDEALAARGGNTPKAQAILAGTGAGRPASKPVAIGDSIAAQLIRNTDGVAGKEYGKEARPDSTATVGFNPGQVLGTINAMPDLGGQDVVLSTGLSNAPDQAQLATVAEQIKALKAKGAGNVTVLGLGTRPDVAPLNDPLAKVAADNGAAFTGPLRKVQSDGIHSSSAKDLLAQAQATSPVITDQPPTAPLPGQGVLTRGQQTLATLPDYMTARASIQNNPGLNDRQRKLALDGLTSQFHQETALYNALDTNAKRDLSDRQTANGADLLSRGIKGEIIDPSQLSDWVRTQQITPEALRAYQAETARQGKGSDDLSTFNDLDRRARAGEDVSQDIQQAVEFGKLRGVTALQLQRANDARKQREGDQVEKANFSTLRTLAGGDAVEKGLVNFGNEAQVRQVQLWTQAQREWNQRVLIGKEDSNAVLADMAPRYGHPIEDVGALPRPRMGGIAKPDDVATVAQKTQAARDSGQLTDQQFREEQALIVRYKGILDAQQQRKDAAAGAKGAAPTGAARGRVEMQ